MSGEEEGSRWQKGIKREGDHDVVVDDKNAILQFPRDIQTCHHAEGDHSTMVKLKNKASPTYAFIRDFLKNLDMPRRDVTKDPNTLSGAIDGKDPEGLHAALKNENMGLHIGNLPLLHRAIPNNDCLYAGILVKSHLLTIMTEGENGCTPLHVEVLEKHHWAIELLLENGSMAGTTATCKKIHNCEVQEKFETHHEKCYSDMMPIHLATQSRDVGLMRYLLQFQHKGIRINAQATDRFNRHTPKNFAIKEGDLNMIKLLLESGANLDDVGKDGDTPLNTAARFRREDIAKYLLDHGANIDCPGLKMHSTPSQIAAGRNQRVILELFLHTSPTGPDWEIEDTCGKTILHIAVLGGVASIVRFLLAGGVDTEKRSNKGFRALEIAQRKKNEEVAEIIENAGKEAYQARDKSIWNPENTSGL